MTRQPRVGEHCPCGNVAVKIAQNCPVCARCLKIEQQQRHDSRGYQNEHTPKLHMGEFNRKLSEMMDRMGIPKARYGF